MQGNAKGMQECKGRHRECKCNARGMQGNAKGHAGEREGGVKGMQGHAGECKGHAGECSCQPLDYKSLSAVPDKSDEIYSTFVEGLAQGRTCPRDLVHEKQCCCIFLWFFRCFDV